LHAHTRCSYTLCIAHALTFDTVQYQSIIAYTLNIHYSDVHINLTDTAHKSADDTAYIVLQLLLHTLLKHPNHIQVYESAGVDTVQPLNDATDNNSCEHGSTGNNSIKVNSHRHDSTINTPIKKNIGVFRYSAQKVPPSTTR
jgi:hypothetical protein